MEERVEELTRRPLYVYDLPQDILSTIQPKDEQNTASVATDDPTDVVEAHSIVSARQDDGVFASSSKSCSLCGVSFNTVEEQRGHTRSDFHNYNLKQKLRGFKPVSENDFEALMGDLDESLSGSDESESDDYDDDERGKTTQLTALLKKQASKNVDDGDDEPMVKRKRGSGKPPLIWFTTPILPSNTYLGIYRAILSNAEQQQEPQILDIIKAKQLVPKPVPKISKDSNDRGVPQLAAYRGPHVFLCMIGGGHFAAMVVSLEPKQVKTSAPGPLAREATVLAHKTFHRYTTRRKQGGAQSSNDNAKGNAHSAGAGIRRYNEAALQDEIRQLLSDWKGMIDTSELLFIRATGTTSRRTLYGPYEDQTIRSSDPRIRGFPFNTRRATQKELMRSFIELTRVKIQQVDEQAIAAAAAATEAASLRSSVTKTKQATPIKPKISEEEETALLHTSQIQALIRRSKVPALISYLKSNELSADFHFYPRDSQQNHHASTPLHLAASLNSGLLVFGLLVKGGASPMLPNGDGKPAFDLCGDRSTRDSFRVSRQILGESSFDWEAAHVPSPMSAAEAGDRDATEKEEARSKEVNRREAEFERLRREGPKISENAVLGKAAGRGRALALGQVQKTAQEKREEEMKGMTPEMRMRLERERRARAAEERIKKISGNG